MIILVDDSTRLVSITPDASNVAPIPIWLPGGTKQHKSYGRATHAPFVLSNARGFANMLAKPRT